jgi:hypothetical protein
MGWNTDFIERCMSERRRQLFQQGLEEGRIQARREDIVKVLDTYCLGPTSQQISELAACTDLARLTLWFDRSLTAATAADVFKD